MTREQMINTLKANTTVENNKAFAVVLYKKNFYSKRVFTDIITTVDTYEQANALTKELKSKCANELKECDATVTFATTDLFTQGYSYNFAKQS